MQVQSPRDQIFAPNPGMNSGSALPALHPMFPNRVLARLANHPVLAVHLR